MSKEILLFLKKQNEESTNQKSWKNVPAQKREGEKKGRKDIICNDCNHIATYFSQWHILNCTFFAWKNGI